MKEHHHNNHHGNGHHRRSSSHVEHINILDQLGNFVKEEVKRGLSLIDTCVNQLAEARFILTDIEKKIQGSYTDCPACHDHKSKHVTSSYSPVKNKHSEQMVIKKEKEEQLYPTEERKYEIPTHNAKPGPKSKTKIKSPSPVDSVIHHKSHQPPCNYSREKAMSSKKILEKDKPVLKLSDISNVIKGRRRVHLSDFPALQGPKKKKRKVSVSSVSESESCTVVSQKKRKHKAVSKKFKSKEIIIDTDSSSEEEKISISEMLKKKNKHKHRHEKHHKHQSKSKVKEIGGKSSFFDKISLAKSDVTEKSDYTKASKPEKSHSVRDAEPKSNFLEKVTQARSDVTDKTDEDVKPSKPTKGGEHIEKRVHREKSADKRVNREKSTEKRVEHEKSPGKRVERERSADKLVDREKSPEKRVERERSPEKPPRKEEVEKVDIKAMLLSKAKPDLIKQRLLEKFKQFTEARKVIPEVKQKEAVGEVKEMDAIGLKIEKDGTKDKTKETFESSILSSIQAPMALQDMIEEDELNEKRSNSVDSMDEFIHSVLHNNNDTVTEKEILRILKENYCLDEKTKSVELKAETQVKIKEAIGQFQTVIVAHLQGGGSESTGNKPGNGSEASTNSDGASNVEGAQGSSDENRITNNEQGNIVILNDSQLPSGELTIGNYFLIGREGYPLQLMKYVGGNNFEPLQMSSFTPQQLNVMKNSLL